MYSVNIDKLMDIDSEKKESLVQIAHNITEALSSGKSVAVIGGKVDTFRIAYSIMEAGNKVLFVDGDITSDVFLGKYKLGKNARGVMDYLKNPDEDYELVEMAKRFARKRQYEVDDDALLELYLKIDKLHNVNDNIKLDDIKEIINQAIVNSERRASRRFFGGLKKKRSENGDVIFLTEADFKDR